MKHKLSRRGFFWTAGGMLVAGRGLLCDQKVLNQPALDSKMGPRSLVSLVQGASRRKNVCQSLLAIEHQILPQLRQKKYVVIKPNIVSTVNPLAATHVDALHGILDFLAPRFKGPVVIAESAAGFTPEGFDNFRYREVIQEHKSLQVSLLDLNEEARYEMIPILNADLHATPVRLAARLLDPEAFIICSAILKTHNVVVATLSIKNMTLGAPLHNSRKETKRWNDKRLYHGGVRQTHYDIFLTAQKMTPFWGATVIDGYEGMEGNGPASGFPVPSRIAIASTDLVAADRVAIEAMGIDATWVGYLNYCGQFGLGQHDLARIDVQGARVSDVAKKYQLHQDIERELQWMGPMTDLPPKLG